MKTIKVVGNIFGMIIATLAAAFVAYAVITTIFSFMPTKADNMFVATDLTNTEYTLMYPGSYFLYIDTISGCKYIGRGVRTGSPYAVLAPKFKKDGTVDCDPVEGLTPEIKF